MLLRVWTLLKDTVEGYFNDGAMSRGAAIGFYTVFSIAPLLVIATAIAGFVFGQDAVEGVIAEQLRGLMGARGAEAVQAMIRGAGNWAKGTVATIIGIITLLLTSSGVFVELQTALNEIWRAPAPQVGGVGGAMTRLLRARAVSLGLVATTGFLMLVSLLVSAGLTALATWAGGLLPHKELLIGIANFLISFLTITLMFGAIYKILPDRDLHWRDVTVGAVATALLFTIGKTLIGWYIGGSHIATTYGAAGALMVLLIWVFYSAQIFLLGAEFTKSWAGGFEGNPEALAAGARPPEAMPDRPRRRRRKEKEVVAATGPKPPGKARGLLLQMAALGTVLVSAVRRRR